MTFLATLIGALPTLLVVVGGSWLAQRRLAEKDGGALELIVAGLRVEGLSVGMRVVIGIAVDLAPADSASVAPLIVVFGLGIPALRLAALALILAGIFKGRTGEAV